MAALHSRCGHISSFFFSSPNLNGCRLDVYHTSTHDVVLVRSEMCCTRLAENTGRKNWPSAHHRTTLSGYICATKPCIDSQKKNSNISSTCPQNMLNFGLLTAETGWRVWGTPANFNWVRVLASLLQRRRSTKVHQTLHDIWLSAGLLYYMYTCPLTEFCQVQNSLCIQVLRFPVLAALAYCTALEQWASAKLCGMVQGTELWNCRQCRA